MTYQEHGTRRWAAGIVAVGALMLISVYVLPALADSDNSSECEKVNQVARVIARGQNPGGKTWRIESSIQGDCRHSLVGWQFLPSGGLRGSWSGKWSIPTGGHLLKSATIAARDEASDSARAFSGVVGGDVVRVIVSTQSGETFTIRPKLPTASLRQRYPWLRRVRYFMRFYSVGDSVKRIELLKGNGEVKYSALAAEGSIEGPMSAS